MMTAIVMVPGACIGGVTCHRRLNIWPALKRSPSRGPDSKIDVLVTDWNAVALSGGSTEHRDGPVLAATQWELGTHGRSGTDPVEQVPEEN